MATKKRGLIQRLFGSKKTSFESINTDDGDDEMAVLQAFQSSSTALVRRHTVDVETFRGELSDKALMAAASRRAAERHRSDLGLMRRLYSRVVSPQSPITTPRRQPAILTPPRSTKPASEPAQLPEKPFSQTEDYADEHLRSNGSFRRRINRRDRALRFGCCRVDITQPIVYPTTPEMILEYHNAMPFLDENEEWLMVELNEYECLVDGLEIIKIIANHSKFFEVEPDELWEEFFKFVDDVPAYDEVINFDVWQEFRDKKYTC